MYPLAESRCMIDSLVTSNLNLKQIGLHLPRPRSQRGELSDTMPKRGKLARGRYWARWRIYVRQPDGREIVKRAERIIFTAKTTFCDVAREYIDLNKPNWEASTSRVNVQIIEDHLIAKLGNRPVRELSDSELQRFVNIYVEQQASRSFLAKLGLFLRAVLNRAADRGLGPRALWSVEP